MVSGGLSLCCYHILHLLQDLKAGKMHYRATFDNFKEQRTTLDALAASLAEAKKALILEFDKWFATCGQVREGSFGRGSSVPSLHTRAQPIQCLAEHQVDPLRRSETPCLAILACSCAHFVQEGARQEVPAERFLEFPAKASKNSAPLCQQGRQRPLQVPEFIRWTSCSCADNA
eukprot:1144256-Pelagomonas_calceolata.AAC.9